LFVLAALLALPFSGWAQTAGQKLLPRHVPATIQRLKPIGPVPASQKLRLAVGLPLRQTDELTNLLRQLYDPNSTNYHHYLTANEFKERFGPTIEDYQTVVRFAESNGLEVAGTHDSRMVLDLWGKASDVERVFHVKLQAYQHPAEARRFYAPDVAPSVDASLPIQDVIGLSDYAMLKPASHRRLGTTTGQDAAGSGPNGNYMGYDFRQAYAPGVSLDGTGQMVGLLEADGYYTNDILAYESLAGLPNVPLQNILIDSFRGVPGTNNNEVALDIEMAISMAPGLASVVVFETPDSVPDWLDVLEIMSEQTQIKQFSSSWGYSDGENPNAV
jgi:subtilase family serine protease